MPGCSCGEGNLTFVFEVSRAHTASHRRQDKEEEGVKAQKVTLQSQGFSVFPFWPLAQKTSSGFLEGARAEAKNKQAAEYVVTRVTGRSADFLGAIGGVYAISDNFCT